MSRVDAVEIAIRKAGERCRGAVRRLVRDLPSFDSVWIDVLLQHRLLTPYQARVLDSADPDRLRLGGHIIRECLEENAWRGVYRGRSLEGDSIRLLTVHSRSGSAHDSRGFRTTFTSSGAPDTNISSSPMPSRLQWPRDWPEQSSARFVNDLSWR